MPKLIITFVALLISLSLGFVLDWPKYQDLRNIQENIVQKRLDIKNKEENFLELTVVRENLENHTESLTKIDSALPPASNLPALFMFLQKSTVQDGLILKGLPPVSSSPSNRSGVKEIRLSLSLSGSYSAFKNYLKTLRETSRFIEVESISFSSPTESGIFSFSLKIKTQSY